MSGKIIRKPKIANDLFCALNHIIGNDLNGSLMSLIAFQNSLCGIKRKKKRYRSHDFLFPPVFLQPGLSFPVLYLRKKLNKNQPVLMKTTVLETQSADGQNMKIRLGFHTWESLLPATH